MTTKRRVACPWPCMGMGYGHVILTGWSLSTQQSGSHRVCEVDGEHKPDPWCRGGPAWPPSMFY
jgi:hypothetical protein